MSAMVIYFSRAGFNYVNGEIKWLDKGNTEKAAEMVAQLTGARLFKVEPLCPYSEDYSECIEQAKDYQRRDARPEIVAYPEGLENCDEIYLGYPNYWGTMPMQLFTLLENCDFSGKTIYPFCTNEGSGMGTSESDIKRLCPHSTVKKGLAIHGARVDTAKADIEKWLKGEAK